MKIGSLVQCISNDPDVINHIISWMPGFKKEDIYTVSDLIKGLDHLGKDAVGVRFEELSIANGYSHVNAKYFVELQGPDEVNVKEIVDNAILQPA